MSITPKSTKKTFNLMGLKTGHVNFYGELLILHSKNSDVKFIIYRVFFARRFTNTF